MREVKFQTAANTKFGQGSYELIKLVFDCSHYMFPVCVPGVVQRWTIRRKGSFKMGGAKGHDYKAQKRPITTEKTESENVSTVEFRI